MFDHTHCLIVSALQVLVYFAVAKLGQKPTDGKTDVNPEGLTAGEGWECFVHIGDPQLNKREKVKPLGGYGKVSMQD